MSVLLLVLGAVIGWIGSVTGSVLIGRHELSRRARIRIYQELLPPLIDLTLDTTIRPDRIERAQMEALYREGVLAGRCEQRLAQVALEAWRQRAAFMPESSTDAEGSSVMTPESLARWGETRERLLSALVAFESFTEKKIR